MDEFVHLKLYEREIKKGIKFLQKSDALTWITVPVSPTDTEDRQRIRLFEAHLKEGMYLLKADGVLKCSADKVLKLNVDNSYVTRCQWDYDDLSAIRQCESYKSKTLKGEIRIVQSVIGVPSFTKLLGMQDRDLLGAQYNYYDPKSQTHVLVFKTIEHPRYKCPPSRVESTGTTILRIEERGPNKCFVQVIAYVNPGGWIPSMAVSFYKERMRDRLLLYEAVAQGPYHEIYHEWPCPRCKLDQNPSEPTCRTCQDIDNPALGKRDGIYGKKVDAAEILFQE